MLFARYYLAVPWVIPVVFQLPTALVLSLLARPTVREERVQAVCLAADASGSTAVGQRLAHDAYAALMMDYSRTLARCVTARGGLALPPHGERLCGALGRWLTRSAPNCPTAVHCL
jgi:class 3 adenylate cyclase